MTPGTGSPDVLVIGAGVNGAAIARDAAMRGLQVTLVDKNDLAGGTTSASTRLIHGGLRYLEHFEVSLVRESLHERKLLLEHAPHLVRPLRFVIPTYEEGSRSHALIRLGMMAYDVLSFDRHVEGHHMLTAAQTLQHAPGLDEDGLTGGALYKDAQAAYSERLVVENALSARDHGAQILTHTAVTGFDTEAGRIVGVRLQGQDGATTLAPAAVINAAGPWVDGVLGLLPGSRPRLVGGTKGTHLVVRQFPGAPQTALYTEAVDNRPYFVVPWESNYLIGTTDERFDGDLDAVDASSEEIDYLISSTNQVIPEAHLGPDDVLFTYAGVRPLPHQPDVSAGQVTRAHLLPRDEQLSNLFSVVGGKLTTHRKVADDAVDLVGKILGRRSGCPTEKEPLPGGRTADWPRFAEQFRASCDLPTEVADHLLEVYGTRAAELLDFIGDDRRLRSILPDAPVLAGEALFAVREEMAATVSDIYLRRTMLGLQGDRGLPTLETATTVLHDYLSWPDDLLAQQADAYRDLTVRQGVKN